MTNVQDYLRESHMPHIWCPGCGNGIVMGNIIRAIDELGLDRDKTVIVSGIGCSSRAPGYMDFDTLHTAHGRALPFATGIKMANPDLNVIVISGDGDATAIGGNHFIHACRRNVDITLVVVNNCIYGMTSGQFSAHDSYRQVCHHRRLRQYRPSVRFGEPCKRRRRNLCCPRQRISCNADQELYKARDRA